MVEQVGGGVTRRHLDELEELVDELLGFLKSTESAKENREVLDYISQRLGEVKQKISGMMPLVR